MTADRPFLSTRSRIAISLLVVGHLAAVVLPPLSFQTRGPLGQSPAVATAFGPIEGYSQFLYIDRGYAFFAPDPGPSHLVQAAITARDGETSETLIPDLQQHWPRLLYHRHFMMTEFLEEIYHPPGPPLELVQADRDEAEMWVRARARYEHVRQSVIDHLRHEHPDHEVAIRRIEHLVPDLVEYQREPFELTDPRLYQVILDRPFESGDTDRLIAPASPPETVPSPKGAAVAREDRIRVGNHHEKSRPSDEGRTGVNDEDSSGVDSNSVVPESNDAGDVESGSDAS